MGRKKNPKIAEKPLNVRLFVEDQNEIKRLAKMDGVAESDVHRELISEALEARRAGRVQSSSGVDSGDGNGSLFADQIERIESILVTINVNSQESRKTTGHLLFETLVTRSLLHEFIRTANVDFDFDRALDECRRRAELALDELELDALGATGFK